MHLFIGKQLVTKCERIEEIGFIGIDIVDIEQRLVAKDVNATATLDSDLSRLVRNPESPALLPPIALPREGRLPLMAYPLRLSDLGANPFAAGRAFIVLVDPEERRLVVGPRRALAVGAARVEGLNWLAEDQAKVDSMALPSGNT